MQIVQDALEMVPPRICPEGAVITIGNFDGVHKGHQTLIEEAAALGRKTGMPLIIFTFYPHSGEHIPGKRVRRIFTESQKDQVMEQLAPEAVLVQFAFDDQVRGLDEERFFREILQERYHAGGIVVGEDFRYGYLGKGSAASLQQECDRAGIPLIVVKDLLFRDEDGASKRVSSTLIREKLEAGEIETVNRLLCCPYYVEGYVLHGKQLGRTIDMPTVNLILPEGLAEPRHGVYRSRVTTPYGVFTGVTNVGTNPTVEHGRRIKIETNLIGFDGDLYEKPIKVEFLDFLRPEQKFPDVEALQAQMLKDRQRAIETSASEGIRSEGGEIYEEHGIE